MSLALRAWTRILNILSILVFGGSLWLAPDVSWCSPAPEPPEELISLSLEKSIEIALTQATVVLQQQNQYQLTSAEVLQNYGRFLPNLVTGLGYSYETGATLYTIQGRTVVDLKGQNANFNLISALNLFNGLADYSGLKSALARQNAVSQSVEWAKQQVALDITQTYLQLVLDQQLLEIARKNLLASQSRLKLLSGQTRVGVTSISDLYRQQADTSANQLSVTNFEARFENDQTLLLRKLRVDPSKSYRFENPDLKPVPSALARRPLNQLIADTIDSRSDVNLNRFQLEANDWQITESRAGYYPRLDLIVQRLAVGRILTEQNINGQDALALYPSIQPNLGAQLGNQVEYTFGLTLTWNIFDRFVTHLHIEQARVNRENTRINLEDSHLQVTTDIRLAYNNYAIALRQIDTARVGLESAQKSYEAVNGTYEVGAASIVDVLTAQAALVQAEANHAQALINLKLQERTLQFAVGKILSDSKSSSLTTQH